MLLRNVGISPSYAAVEPNKKIMFYELVTAVNDGEPVQNSKGHTWQICFSNENVFPFYCLWPETEGGHCRQLLTGKSACPPLTGHFAVPSCVHGMPTGQPRGMPLPYQINS
jgi:hypothetical protein